MGADKPATFEEVRELFRTITYKPGWSYDLWYTPIMWDTPGVIRSHWAVRMSAPVTDVLNGQPSVVYSGMPVPEGFPLSEYPKILYRVIESLERHEQAEWFKVKGVPLVNPHPIRLEPPDFTQPGFDWTKYEPSAG